MAYKKDELEAQALDAITRHNLFFIEDVVAYLPCSHKTFYNKKLHELQAIKEALDQNKIRTKNGLRSKWFKDGNATTQIALYKLLSNEDELRRLTGQTIMGDQDKPLQHRVKLTTDDIESDAIE